MEKFAVDLDKVLDEFEFNEDCAEQVASVGDVPGVKNKKCLPVGVNQQIINSTSTSTSNNNNNSNNSNNSVHKEDKLPEPVIDHKTIIHLKADKDEDESRSNTSEENYEDDSNRLDTLDIRKSDVRESVNEFSKAGYQKDDKVQRKESIDFSKENDRAFHSNDDKLTIHNDIQQNFGQKRLNETSVVGTTVANKSNSYDKRLNQPNSKPSVSNVFNSLNEYINASSANMERIDCSVDRDECKNAGEPVRKPTTSLPEYQNILLPVKCDVKKPEEEKSRVKEEMIPEAEASKPLQSIQPIQPLKIDRGTVDCTKHIYENVDININIDGNIPNNSEVRVRSKETSRSTSQDESKHVYENVDFVKPNSQDEGAYERLYIGGSDLPETTTELEIAAKRLNEQFNLSNKKEDTLATGGINPTKLVFQNVNLNPSGSGSISGASAPERKPVGFSTIDDLSEEELNKYLAELEAEERASEAAYENISVPRSSATYANINASARAAASSNDDEDANEAPIFESVTIGELPEVSEEKLQEKAKKFPVIDYSKSSTSGESIDFLDEPEKLHHEPVKIVAEKERKIKKTGETVRKSSDTLESVPQELKPENGFSEDSVGSNSNFNSSGDNKIQAADDSADKVENKNNDTVLPQNKAIINEINESTKTVNEHQDSSSIDNNSSTIEGNSGDGGEEVPNGEPTASEDQESVDRPVRPQTLDIVSTVTMIEQSSMPGVTNTEEPSATTVTAAPSINEESERERDPSPDVSDSSSMEFGIMLGKQPPFWVPDSEAPNCMMCDMRFTVIKRRHHCRACGKVLCNKCCNLKYRLEYQKNVESRVCSTCYLQLIRTESDHGSGDWSGDYTSNPGSMNSPQLAGGLPSPPSVMVPVGVLKREGSTKQRLEGPKSVMFSDGIRPGCDLTELDASWDLKPPYRKVGNKRIPSPGAQSTSATAKRQNLPPLDPHTNSYIPQDVNMLPPTVTIHKGQIMYHEVIDTSGLYQSLKNESEPPVMFAINRNLYAYVKITNLNCCVNKICWNVTSRGLACVGQDEVIFLIETLPEESLIPKDLLIHINQLYIEAIKGNTVTELGVSIHQGGNLLGSREHAGFLFIRQTFQCLQKIVLPPAPFLVGLLVHRWETPWAKVFPLRLVLRLGAEYRYYPCPLVSVRFRDAVYFEIGHTIMKVLADFRNYAYTLPSVRGLTIHMQDRTTDVLLPRNRYDQVIKGLNNSNDHVLAFAANFSIHADSHLVCIQTNTGDESNYQTQAINIHNKPRRVTGASFVVVNGALKSSMGLSAKSSIVEDGLMVQIMPEKMEALKAALKNMHDFSIGCGRQGAPEPDETVNIKWVDNDVQFNLGVKSPIDGKAMDGVPSIRVHNGTDYMGTSRFIRWTEVFIIKSDDHPNGVHDPVDINKLSENIARATCTALVKLLDLLATAGLTKLGVRATIHPDNVGYEAGSESTRLPPIYMNSLDNELIQVLHKAAQSSQEINTVLELIFHVLDD
ncbi:zinc finger FYVE domain-containing protein 16 isoform X3 [Cotesia glomerata]|uniref:zinc finger FYVE domain-containing protein 16 isoform X3 n=1 Tax=Cotesia glomerata TaxID=32391 RepID=UPI001D00B319|nr:zinc finger FYVE domain-containing protein 16 isoform X3 [Cotesia glomerata]